MNRTTRFIFIAAAGMAIAAARSATAASDPRDPRTPDASVLLWPGMAPIGDGTQEKSTASIRVFLPPKAQATGTAVVICPGGGYGGKVLTHEGSYVAQWLNSHGIAGIVLDYRLPHGRHAVPLLDAQRAIRLARANAKAWDLRPNRIGIMGFSAGGHLASTAGTHFDAGNPNAADAADRLSCRPDFMILIYPVIRMDEQGHKGTRINLLGPDPKPERVTLYSNEKQVTDQTPPAFLAHAQDDKTVPPLNSASFCDALKAHHIPAEYLKLPYGGHGLSGYKGPMWEAWHKGALAWLAQTGFLPPAK